MDKQLVPDRHFMPQEVPAGSFVNWQPVSEFRGHQDGDRHWLNNHCTRQHCLWPNVPYRFWKAWKSLPQVKCLCIILMLRHKRRTSLAHEDINSSPRPTLGDMNERKFSLYFNNTSIFRNATWSCNCAGRTRVSSHYPTKFAPYWVLCIFTDEISVRDHLPGFFEAFKLYPIFAMSNEMVKKGKIVQHSLTLKSRWAIMLSGSQRGVHRWRYRAVSTIPGSTAHELTEKPPPCSSWWRWEVNNTWASLLLQ